MRACEMGLTRQHFSRGGRGLADTTERRRYVPGEATAQAVATRCNA